ncbi:MAG: hypothetical protein LUC50_09810 [Ruminococcus sp.]|nr:hypothetical protein [Ruminococcus sp.]
MQKITEIDQKISQLDSDYQPSSIPEIKIDSAGACGKVFLDLHRVLCDPFLTLFCIGGTIGYVRQHRTKTAFVFACHLLTSFPLSYQVPPCNTQSIASSSLNNLKKNLLAHLTHNLCAVLP